MKFGIICILFIYLLLFLNFIYTITQINTKQCKNKKRKNKIFLYLNEFCFVLSLILHFLIPKKKKFFNKEFICINHLFYILFFSYIKIIFYMKKNEN